MFLSIEIIIENRVIAGIEKAIEDLSKSSSFENLMINIKSYKKSKYLHSKSQNL